MNPAEGPTAAESAMSIARPRSVIAPTVTVGVSTSTINEGDFATFTFATSKANPNSGITVNYSMSGTAALGTHYTLTGPAGRVVIPAGASSASVILNALLTNLSSGSEVATMNLQSGTGYRLPVVPNASVTILNTSAASSPTPTATPIPTATPVPTATPASSPTQHIWIALRTDGLPGSGTQTDPYDGSTPQKFDNVLRSCQGTNNLGIHLVGTGPFQTDIRHTWNVKSGWVISGDGMNVTTVQMVGSAAGQHYGFACLSSDPNVATDNVTITNLTVDCNWAEISITADTGANGEKNVKTSAVVVWGSNNLIDHVRCINSYGSQANGQEQFAIALGGPRTHDGTNNYIQFCRVEQPFGNYGNPYGLFGWVPYLITNSKVLSCTAAGINDGTNDGFNTGGVNLHNIKDCQIDRSTFIDCQGAAYQDGGSCDGLQVTNNTVIRGQLGVGLASSTLPKQNITVRGNNFLIQNRWPDGGSYGFGARSVVTTNLTIDNNTITFDNSGSGMPQFWGVYASPLMTATISNNVVAMPSMNQVSGVGITLLNNHQPNGDPVPGL
jgi:hypothetical protein